jgi:AAA+ ATPase superfamily predicted ATPase
MKYEIVGRKKEIKKLDEIFTSKEAEFLALYGRRRVGKTYLVRQYFESQSCVFFEVTGLKDGSLDTQLGLLANTIEKTFYKESLMFAKSNITIKSSPSINPMPNSRGE